jgi:hypothetical protein
MNIWLISIILLINFSNSFAGPRSSQKDTLGNTQHQKTSFTIQGNGRIIETDSIGNKQFHHQQYLMKEGKLYQTDSLGNVQYHKPSFVIHNDGKIVEYNSSGNIQYQKQQYENSGKLIYPIDSLGNRQFDKPSYFVE